MIIHELKKDGITKDEIQRNVDFTFLTKEEQDEKVKESMKKFIDGFMDGLNKVISEEEAKGE